MHIKTTVLIKQSELTASRPPWTPPVISKTCDVRDKCIYAKQQSSSTGALTQQSKFAANSQRAESTHALTEACNKIWTSNSCTLNSLHGAVRVDGFYTLQDTARGKTCGVTKSGTHLRQTTSLIEQSELIASRETLQDAACGKTWDKW